jgi:hypothetical protein
MFIVTGSCILGKRGGKGSGYRGMMRTELWIQTRMREAETRGLVRRVSAQLGHLEVRRSAPGAPAFSATRRVPCARAPLMSDADLDRGICSAAHLWTPPHDGPSLSFFTCEKKTARPTLAKLPRTFICSGRWREFEPTAMNMHRIMQLAPALACAIWLTKAAGMVNAGMGLFVDLWSWPVGVCFSS